MIVARGQGGDTEVLLLVLGGADIEGLMAGQLILVRRETHGEGVPESWAVGLLFGETEQAAADTDLAGEGGPTA